MNINELASKTCTPKDTIRVYREKGLLHPQKNPDNNYYIYTLRDFCTLLFIKKMRYFCMPLNKIKALMQGCDSHKLLQEYEVRIEQLKKEQELIQDQLNHVMIAKSFLENTMEEEGFVYEKNFSTSRYDIYPNQLREEEQSIFQSMLANSAIYINTIYISKEHLMDSTMPMLPIEVGLGINDHMIEKYSVSVPEQALVFPSGTYLVMLIKISSFQSIPRSSLNALLQYADAHNFEIISGITSFLAYIDQNQDAFYYRIRVLVQKRSVPI